jgi:hypothetical protein
MVMLASLYWRGASIAAGRLAGAEFVWGDEFTPGGKIYGEQVGRVSFLTKF